MAASGFKSLASCGWKCVCEEQKMASQLLSEFLDMTGMPDEHSNCFYLVCNGKIVRKNDTIGSLECVYFVPRIFGGKGGFGSMLRAIGAQIEKTTNREACRDLSGRRLRDINEEMRLSVVRTIGNSILKKWITKQAEREEEKAAKNRQRLERRLATPKHEFSDAAYDKHRSELGDKVTDALSQGLSVAESNKRSAPMEGAHSKSKKPKLWLGIEDELSDVDSDSEDVGQESLPSTSRSLDEHISPSASVDQTDHSKPSTSTSQTPQFEVKSRLKLEAEAPKSSPIQIAEDTTSAQVSEALDLDEFDCVENLELLGLDRLKLALRALGMKCGGTLRQRAERLFAVRGIAADQIDPALFTKQQSKSV